MFTSSELLAIGLLEYRNKNKVTKLMDAINSLKREGFSDDQINLIVLDVAQAVFKNN